MAVRPWFAAASSHLGPEAPPVVAALGGLLDPAGFAAAIDRLASGFDARRIYVAVFGIDQYSRLKALLGRDLADRLVVLLGERLERFAPETPMARTADDALAIAFQAPTLDAAMARTEDIRHGLEMVYAVADFSIDVRLTSGLSAGGAPGALLQAADLALEEARGAHRRSGVFDPVSYAAAVRSLSLMPELRAAIARDELSVAHQPKFDLRRGRVTGVETLVRWSHPQQGDVPPDLFISMAEETGEIRAITEWVLKRAIADQAILAAAGAPLPFSVNLSGRLISDAAVIDDLLRIAAAAKAPICLEITETAVIADPQAALANLKRIRAAGLGVSIDDYGCGLSSLSYLKLIPAVELKLDKSLVQEIACSRRDALIIRSTIDLAHALGMAVAAEGVETEQSLALLSSMGCDVVQGFLIARPMPLAKLQAFLSAPPRAEAPRPAPTPAIARVV